MTWDLWDWFIAQRCSNFINFRLNAHLHNQLLLPWNKWTENCANVDVEMKCLEAKEEFKHTFSLCWFATELLSVFIFLFISFAENLKYQRFCLVLILTSNVQLHLSTLYVRFFFCFFSTLSPTSLLSSKKLKCVSFLF